MRFPRHADLWFPGYMRGRIRTALSPKRALRRAWIAVCDHYEPLGGGADLAKGRERVGLWLRHWPEIAGKLQDSSSRPPRYSFFYPQEEYRPELLDPLAEMTHAGICDVEVHIHHDREGRQNFIDRMSSFCEALSGKHGLLRRVGNKLTFGFIHGNWALDNSLPGGRWCGLNDEITILKDLGCYADFTMPSGDSPSQACTVNQIYWCTDDPDRPKSHDRGVPVRIGGRMDGDLMMITGPIGLRWRERLVPRFETGEIAGYDAPTAYRVRRWFDIAPRIGSDVFIKLYTHGAQERNSALLLVGGDLESLYRLVREEARRRSCEFYLVSAWEMFRAIEAVRQQRDPVMEIALLPQQQPPFSAERRSALAQV
jgi:hypothetical protein